MAFLTLFIVHSLLVFIFPTILPSQCKKTSETLWLQTKLTHVDQNKNLTKIELMRLALDGDSKRLQWLSLAASRSYAKNTGFSILASLQGAYVMNMSVGTPPTSLELILSLSNSFLWAQCNPCHQCVPGAPMFDPEKSSSYSILKCSTDQCMSLDPTRRPMCAENPGGNCWFNYKSGDDSIFTQGNLATETLWSRGKKILQKIPFGCVFNNTQDLVSNSGIAGMGKGNLSLVQYFKDKKFSYCLPVAYSMDSGVLLLGNRVITPRGAITTTLINNPQIPDLYYVSLESIRIGGIPLAINNSAFAIQDDGSGGMFIEPGNTLTYLEASAFQLVKQALIDQINLDVVDGSAMGFDLCFDLYMPPCEDEPSCPAIEFPKFELLFEGGANLELEVRNYFDIVDHYLNVGCLLMAPSGVSILGNLAQQNTLVIYNLDQQQTISFVPNACPMRAK